MGGSEARVVDLSFAPMTCLRYSMSVDIRTTMLTLFVVAVLAGMLVSLVVVSFARMNDADFDGTLTHKEYMQLSSHQAKGLRICQRNEATIEEYAVLKSAQQREGQPTMPKFVDPGDPLSFQETMWEKGYKCQEDDWLTYVRD